MKRPVRTYLSPKNLSIMGVPKKFHNQTIDDFLTYGEEDLIHVRDAVKEYLHNLPQSFENNQGLLLYGSNGVGKTFISCMIVKEAYRHRYTSHRVTFVEYINSYTRMWGAKTPEEKELLEQEFYNNYKAVEFLVLEEIGKEVDSKVAAPILEDCLRYREDNGLVTIVCTNLSVSVIKERYGASVMSLMKGNMTPIRIEGKDKRKEFFDTRLEGSE